MFQVLKETEGFSSWADSVNLGRTPSSGHERRSLTDLQVVQREQVYSHLLRLTRNWHILSTRSGKVATRKAMLWQLLYFKPKPKVGCLNSTGCEFNGGTSSTPRLPPAGIICDLKVKIRFHVWV